MSQTQRTVLIVDDSPEDCEVYRRYLLGAEGYEYTVVATGLAREGLALHQLHQPDIVLLDYRMPDLDGIEFLAQLQAQTHHSILPVVMLTGRGNEMIAVQSMKMGAQDYVVKEQVTSESLQLTVNGAIEMVQIRLQLLHQIELEQVARAEAETANRIKDEFLAVLSHELRSPLNPILGWSKLLRTHKLDEAKTAQALTTIERNAKLQAELIEDLLDISRILQGKLSLNICPLDLTITTQAAVETVQLAAEAKSIEIEMNLDAEVGQILGDNTRLQQVIWNLLSNAIKFTPVGGRVMLRLEPVGNWAQITIVDEGQGISADFLPHIFDYFRQADSSTARSFGGLGLGLAIVRHLVELHGGAVWAESGGEGLGATFTVRLPLMPIQPTVKLNAKPPRSHNLKGVRVLFVDDEADSLELITFALERAGASVTTATNADEALTALTQSPVDILLSDIGMSNTDGYMLMRQIRALSPKQGGTVPAIALTAYAGELDQQRALSVGFQLHLSKPIELDLLVEAIAQVVRGV